MAVRIRVKDKDSKPVANVEVVVLWASGGHSSRRTDSSGLADLGVSSGTAESIRVNNREVSGKVWLDDQKIFEVPDR